MGFQSVFDILFPRYFKLKVECVLGSDTGSDLLPDHPSFITRVYGFDIGNFRVCGWQGLCCTKGGARLLMRGSVRVPVIDSQPPTLTLLILLDGDSKQAGVDGSLLFVFRLFSVWNLKLTSVKLDPRLKTTRTEDGWKFCLD